MRIESFLLSLIVMLFVLQPTSAQTTKENGMSQNDLGWCLKALEEISGIQKGFALSTWDIYSNTVEETRANKISEMEKEADDYFVLNKRSGKALYAAVLQEADFHNLLNSAQPLAGKQVVMLDEHPYNKILATSIQKTNKNYCNYEVWNTDHSFTNKRVSLINRVLAFLDR